MYKLQQNQWFDLLIRRILDPRDAVMQIPAMSLRSISEIEEIEDEVEDEFGEDDVADDDFGDED